MLLFSLLVRCTSPLATWDETSGTDRKRVRRPFHFSPAKKRSGNPAKAQTVLGNLASLCLTRSDTESCRNGGRRREKCTRRNVARKEECPPRNNTKRAGTFKVTRN